MLYKMPCDPNHLPFFPFSKFQHAFLFFVEKNGKLENFLGADRFGVTDMSDHRQGNTQFGLIWFIFIPPLADR